MSGKSEPRPNRWLDQPDGYGWISILLHWTTATAIIALWFIGDSIASDPTGGTRRLHTTLAVSVYALLALRIWWRVKYGHPRHLPAQAKWVYKLGVAMHWFMAALIIVAIISGPLQALSAGQPLYLFDLAIPAPAIPWLFGPMHALHHWATNTLMLAALVHFLAVIKHVSVDRDGSFDRMLTPPDDRFPPPPPKTKAAGPEGPAA
jgi:cytochrome b561